MATVETIPAVCWTYEGVAEREWPLRVGGEARWAHGQETYQTIDPATGEVLGTVADAGPTDVDDAYKAAAAAASGWASTAMEYRAGVVREMAARLLAHGEELATLDAMDTGNPMSAAKADVTNAAAMLYGQAGMALGIRGETMGGRPSRLHYTELEPFGVVARIVAYNHPLLYAVARTTPALLAGNSVILKPAPQTPLSALRWAELIEDLLPRGLFNVLTGRSAALGKAVVGHPGIRRIAFTGSEPVGRAIQRGAAEAAVKTVTLELGGKNAMIVFPDTDADLAARAAFEGMNLTSTQGQSCGSTSRLLVHADIHDAVVEGLQQRLADVRLGPPLDKQTTMGPLISEQHREHVRQCVSTAKQAGATLRLDGAVTLDRGFFHGPVLFTDVRDEMPVAQEEIFGPVVTVARFRTEDEAVAMSNSVRFGLTASVWTDRLSLAHRVARRLEAGYVWINDVAAHYPGMPFGGYKDSGVGREESVEEILSYMQTKSVHVRLR